VWVRADPKEKPELLGDPLYKWVVKRVAEEMHLRLCRKTYSRPGQRGLWSEAIGLQGGQGGGAG
jgi:hypothetical protein